MSERIVYSQEEMMSSLNNAMKELNIIRYDRRFKEALGDTLINKISHWEETIMSQKDTPFTIVVIGDFKRGKSTLINAILGEEIVTSDVTTETVTLNQLDYGTSINEAILSGNRRAILSNNELKRENLEKVILDLGESVEYLQIRRPNEMLKKIRIIDTPGTGDAMKDFSSIVEKSLLQADAVIYVYNIQYPLSKTEQLFLKSVVLPQKQTKLLLVGNYTDVLKNQKEFDYMRQFLKNKIDGFLPNSNIYMISALDELSKQIDGEVEESEITPIIRGQFQNLRNDINQMIDERSDSILISRMQRLVSAMITDISENFNAIENGIKLSKEESQKILNEKLQHENEIVNEQAEIKDALIENVHSMREEASVWMSEFVSKIFNECSNLNTNSSDDIKRYFEFYCVDLLQDAMNKCIEYHEDKIYEMLESISDDVSSKITEILPEERGYQFRMNLDNRIWTKGDTVGLVTSQLSNLGMLGTVASLVTDGVAGFFRERESKEKVCDLTKQISQKFLGLETIVSNTVNQQYKEIESSVEKVVTTYFFDENEKRKNLMEQTIQIAAKSEEEKEEIIYILQESREILNKINNFNQI